MKHLLLTLFLCAMMLPAQTWQIPQAELRMRFSLGDDAARNLLVPVPQELGKAILDVRAMDDDGAVLPATPVRIGGAIAAVAVDASAIRHKGKKSAAPATVASLYFLKDKDASPVPYAGAPVAFRRVVKTLTTRAHTADEMLRMFENLHLIPYPQALASPRKIAFRMAEIRHFGDFGTHTELATVPARPGHDTFLRSFAYATASIAVDKPVRAAFSADPGGVAWTILVDAVPVANWTTEGTPLPQWVDLAPGIHTLQLLSAQSVREPCPQPRVRFDEKQSPAPISGLLPATRPVILALESCSVKDSLTAVTLARAPSFTFTGGETLGIYAASVSKGSYDVAFLDAAGRTIACGASLMVPGRFHPGIRFSAGNASHTLAGQRVWHPTTAMTYTARLATPAFQDTSAPMRMMLALDAPTFLPAPLKARLSFAVEQFRRDGASAEKTAFPASADRMTLEIPIAPQARQLVISGTIGGARAFEDIIVALVYPNDAHLPLRAQGTQLFTVGKRAIHATLLANDLPPSNVENDSAASRKNVIFDDFLLCATAPGADLLPAPPLQLLTATAPMGTIGSLAAPAAIHKLLALKPACAFILAHPLKFDDDALRFKAIANACKTHGIAPVIVILPALPGIPPASARETAFALKTWAARQGIQTKDLFTIALLDGVDTAAWKTASGLDIATINNAARQWLYGQLR